ncbi:MAG: 3-hydroxyacyl-ACP dehydratase FabZ [Armatimonadetes bacterium]|nr:3-hydroxyacyl-ACP dehydratase FabZ [Armatimonadota bacterium]
MYDIEQIRDILPHRYPFLLVDRILELEPEHRAVGLKNVTINEAFFQGHFPGHAIMPGVLVLEAMAQVGGVLLLSDEANRGKLVYLAAMDKVRLRKPVVPGDTLITVVDVLKNRGRTGKIRTVGRVNDQVVAEAELVFVQMDPDQRPGVPTAGGDAEENA